MAHWVVILQRSSSQRLLICYIINSEAWTGPLQSVTLSICLFLFSLKSGLCGSAEPWQEPAPVGAKRTGANKYYH